jgi:hypothetical protein
MNKQLEQFYPISTIKAANGLLSFLNGIPDKRKHGSLIPKWIENHVHISDRPRILMCAERLSALKASVAHKKQLAAA